MVTLTVDLVRLRANLREIKTRVWGSGVYAVVKADAYGHGVEICKHLDGEVGGYCVSCAFEALELIKLGVKKPILILCPSPQIQGVNHEIIYTVTAESDLIRLKNCFVAIKVNTGMNRLGVDENNFDSLYSAVKNRKDLSLKEVFTHFYSPQGAFLQFERFQNLTKNLGVKRHCLASTCLVLPKIMQLDAVRCGLALYGYGEGCKPVLSAKTDVIQVRDVSKTGHIGYGDFVAEKAMQVAVLGAGYADGIKRTAGRTVRINGVLCPVVGNICMDMCMADVSGLSVKRGDFAYLLDDVLNAEVLALEFGTVPYEILTAFNNKRVRREFV